MSGIKKNREKPSGIYTVWDIPRDMSPHTLRKELSFFGNISIIQWRGRETSSAALIQIRFKSIERKQNWESKWAVALKRSGRLLRMTMNEFDKEKLGKRNQYKTKVTNVPKYAIDSLLLRQLSSVNAKSVYI